MSSQYALLPVGSDRNIPPLTDSQLTELAAEHPELTNQRPYASRTRRRHTTTGGAR